MIEFMQRVGFDGKPYLVVFEVEDKNAEMAAIRDDDTFYSDIDTWEDEGGAA